MSAGNFTAHEWHTPALRFGRATSAHRSRSWHRGDTHDKDLADSINDCIHKGGQNSATADVAGAATGYRTGRRHGLLVITAKYQTVSILGTAEFAI